MAIKVNFLSDVDNLVRGTDRVAKSMEDIGTELRDVADEMDKTGRTGDGMGDQIAEGADKADRATKDLGDTLERTGRDGKDVGDDIGRGFKDAESGAERLEDKIRDAMRKAADAADDSGRKIGKSQKDGFDKAGDGADEFKDEANSTARESAASFDGSAESIIDSFQEIAANAFAGFGPAGALAGLAVAAGIGIAINKAQELGEANTDAQETISELAQAFIELGGDLDRLDIGQRIIDWGLEVNEDNWMTFWADEAETNFQRFSRAAEEAGIGTKTAFQAMRGSYEDAQAFMKDTEKAQSSLKDEIAAGTTITENGIPIMDASAHAAKKKFDAIEELRGETVKNMQQQEEAKAIEEIATGVTENNTDAIEAKIDALKELSGELTDSVEADLDYRETVKSVTETIKKNGDSLDRNTDAGRDNWRQLIELKDAALDKADADFRAGRSAEDVARSTMKSRDAFIKAATAAGLGEKEARDLAKSWGLVPEKISTKVTADNTQAKKEVKEIERMTPSVPVAVYASNGSSVQSYINKMNGQTVYVNVQEVAGGHYRV